ncbi:MAG TPA: hypothetical protein VF834_08595, partial [Streptosporangiaceae bacterium]
MTAVPGETSSRPGSYLAAADRLLTEVIPGARGTWPRACAWLIRLALEEELTRFWTQVCPPVAGCTSQRAKQLMLTAYASPDTSHRAVHAWALLSRAGHHQAYELGLTSAELRSMLDDVVAISAALRAEAAAG